MSIPSREGVAEQCYYRYDDTVESKASSRQSIWCIQIPFGTRLTKELGLHYFYSVQSKRPSPTKHNLVHVITRNQLEPPQTEKVRKVDSCLANFRLRLTAFGTFRLGGGHVLLPFGNVRLAR